MFHCNVVQFIHSKSIYWVTTMCQSLLEWRDTSELRFLTEQVSKSFSIVRKHQVLWGLKFIHLGGVSLTNECKITNANLDIKYSFQMRNHNLHILKSSCIAKRRTKIQKKLQSIFINLLSNACFLAALSLITSSYDNLLTFSVRRIGR